MTLCGVPGTVPAMAPPHRLELDAYDTRILAELQSDARLTMAELGRRVHLSQPAVTERRTGDRVIA